MKGSTRLPGTPPPPFLVLDTVVARPSRPAYHKHHRVVILRFFLYICFCFGLAMSLYTISTCIEDAHIFSASVRLFLMFRAPLQLHKTLYRRWEGTKPIKSPTSSFSRYLTEPSTHPVTDPEYPWLGAI